MRREAFWCASDAGQALPRAALAQQVSHVSGPLAGALAQMLRRRCLPLMAPISTHSHSQRKAFSWDSKARTQAKRRCTVWRSTLQAALLLQSTWMSLPCMADTMGLPWMAAAPAVSLMTAFSRSCLAHSPASSLRLAAWQLLQLCQVVQHVPHRLHLVRQPLQSSHPEVVRAHAWR